MDCVAGQISFWDDTVEQHIGTGHDCRLTVDCMPTRGCHRAFRTWQAGQSTFLLSITVVLKVGRRQPVASRIVVVTANNVGSGHDCVTLLVHD